jgi:hypothetical protein
LKKKQEKKFAPAGCGNSVATPRRSKSFLVLFFKKEPLPSSPYRALTEFNG